jgi:branched-chain amino acid transport system permease protein
LAVLTLKDNVLLKRIKSNEGAVYSLLVFILILFAFAVSNMTFSTLMQHIVNGISLASLYALIAIGYTMVYGILRMINFAHGDIFMMASYFTFFGISVFNLPWYVGFALAIVLSAVLGVIIEKLAYRPLRDAPKNSILISAIGVSFLLENLATYLFSGKPKSFPEFSNFTRSFEVFGVRIQIITIVIPIVTVILLYVLLYIVDKTKIGMAMRAVSKDYEIAKVMGIKIDNIISITFIIGSALAAIGAILWGVRYPSITPMIGVMPGLKCFIVAVIGGVGNIKGAVIGGVILGLGEVLIVAFLPSLSGYRDAFAFIFLIIILLYKPTGILGEKAIEKV